MYGDQSVAPYCAVLRQTVHETGWLIGEVALELVMLSLPDVSEQAFSSVLAVV